MSTLHKTLCACLQRIDHTIHPHMSHIAGVYGALPDMRQDIWPVAYCPNVSLADLELRQCFGLDAIPAGQDAFLVYGHLLTVQFSEQIRADARLEHGLMWGVAVQAVWEKLQTRQLRDNGAQDPHLLHLQPGEICEATNEPSKYPVPAIEGLFDQFDKEWPKVCAYYMGIVNVDQHSDPKAEEKAKWRFRRFTEGQVLGRISLNIGIQSTTQALDFLKRCADIALAKV